MRVASTAKRFKPAQNPPAPNGPLALWTELDRAMSLLQLHQELLDSLLAQIEVLRAERDDARMVRMLLLEIRAKQDALVEQLTGLS